MCEAIEALNTGTCAWHICSRIFRTSKEFIRSDSQILK